MANYLLHQNRDGTPVGVWSSPTDFFYGPQYQDKVAYGKSVVSNQGSETTWDDFCDQMASKFPSPHDQWDVYATDGSLELSEVLSEAQENTTHGD